MHPMRLFWHNVKHDIRKSGWALLAYYAVVVVITAKCMEFTGPNVAFADSTPMLLPLAIMIAAAMLAQADEPGRADSFYASKPISPALMLLSKGIVLSGVIDGAALLAQAVALHHFGVSVSGMPEYLLDSVGPVLGYSLTGLVVGAFVPSNKALLLAMIPAVILSSVTLTQDEPLQWATYIVQWRIVIECVIGVVVCYALLRLYHRRRSSRKLVVAFALIGYAMCGASFDFIAGVSNVMTYAPARAERPVIGIVLDSVYLYPLIHRPTKQAELVMDLHLVGDTVTKSAAMKNPRLSIASPDGRTTTSPFQCCTAMLNGFTVSLPESVRRVSASGRPPHYMGEDLADTGGLFGRLSTRGTIVALDAIGVAYDGVVMGDISLTAGGHFVEVGQRSRIRRIPNDTARAWLIHTTVVLNSNGRYSAAKSIDFDQCAFVNPIQKEARSASVLAAASDQWHSLPLPGATVREFEERISALNYSRTPITSTVSDDEWYRDATLTLVHWIPKYSYPIHAEYVVP